MVQEFRDFYIAYFTGKADLSVIDWEKWFHGVGGLPVLPPLDTSIRDSATQLAAEWKSPVVPAVHAHDYATFTPGQRVAFFDELLMAQVTGGGGVVGEHLWFCVCTCGWC